MRPAALAISLPTDQAATDGWLRFARMFALSWSSAVARNSARPRFGLRQLVGRRNLRPDQDPRLVGEVLEVGVERVVRAQQRRVRLLQQRDDPLAVGVAHHGTGRQRVLVQRDAAEVDDRAAVEHSWPLAFTASVRIPVRSV